MKMTLLLLALLSMNTAKADIRCCVDEIKRDENGKIVRSQKVLRDFKKLYPCPATGKNTGACEGWQIDHVVSLACKGKDIVENLQWLPLQIKTCSKDWCKDRWELKYHCDHEIIEIN
jgi:hypothetical protein